MIDRPPTAGLVWGQIRYQNRIFWRTPIAAFFTLAFPFMFLIVFGLVLGSEEIEQSGLTLAQFYAPALAVFGAVSATYTNLAIGTAIARDEGILKRVRGTPLPPWAYLVGRVGSAIYMAVISVVIMLIAGMLFYGLNFYGEAVVGLLITFLVGVATFATLGLLLAALSPTGDSAPALANATLLPLSFFSDIFIATGPDTPAWIIRLADFFPLRHFATAFIDGFEPTFVDQHSGWLDYIHWADLGVMLLWLAGAGFLALRYFTWEPRVGERWSRKRRASSGGATEEA
jgi:ABC-2 type transport system permease protein